jgi:branched-chain amino acid transport system substrate-binding protein
MVKIWKRFFIVCMVLMLVTITNVFANGESEKSTTEDILVGCLQDISGPTSSLGKMVEEGSRMAIDEVNANGGINGRQIKMITYDTKGNVNEAINAFTRAVTLDKVSAIIGPPVANIALAIAPISERYDVPFLDFAIDSKCQIKEDGVPYKNMFGMKPSAKQLGAFMADYAVDEGNFNTFGVIYNESNAYSISLLDPFTDRIKEKGKQILQTVSYTANDKDFKTLLSRIIDSDVDVIYSPGYTQELILVAKQAREMGYKGALILGIDASPPFNTLLGEPADGIYFINNFDDTTAEINAMSKEVKDTKNIITTNKFFLGYDAAKILAQAFAEVGDNPADVQNYVENLDGFVGITGTTTMDPNTHFPKDYELLMYTYENIDPVVLDRFVSSK